MAKKPIASKVADYFASNHSRKEIHATTDGFLFESKQNANNHAKTLDDKKVETFSKSAKVEAKPEPTEAEKEAAKLEAQKKADEAKKQEEAAKKAATNSAG
jgi:cell division protein FtsX